MSRVRIWTVNGVTNRCERLLEIILNRSFSVHQPPRSEARRDFLHPCVPRHHLGSIGMRAVPIDDLHASVKRHIVPKDLENRLSFHYAASKGVLGLKAHDENGITGVARALCQVSLL
jgi:hypothetical protein